MRSAVAAIASASGTASVTWAFEGSQSRARNVPAACCVFLPTVVIVFVVSAFFCAVFTVIWLCARWQGGGETEMWRRLFYCFCRLSLHSFSCCFYCRRWLKGKANTHTHAHTKATTEISAIKSFIYFIYIYVYFLICFYARTFVLFCHSLTLMKLNKNT